MNFPRILMLHHLRALPIAAAILAAALYARPAHADDPPDAPDQDRNSFDPATGRNFLNYPPHVVADVRHIQLHIRIPDMNQRAFTAIEVVTVTPVASDLGSITLNAALLQFDGVSSPNRTCALKENAEAQTVSIALSPPLSLGQSADITLNYHVSDPPEGLIWTIESPAHPGRAAQLHSQGESESNRYWFACQDFPNSRCTTELFATVPRGFQVVSNGYLEKTAHESGESMDTFHWVQDKPHVAYLVSMVVGKFDVVDVGTRKLPMPVYVAPGQADRVRPVFGHTPKMIEFISRTVDHPYPWAKYAQVSAVNFAEGGMENTSATTLEESIALDETARADGDNEDLTVHELTHQWFGDLLTCKSWEHIWLNEGFATYFEGLWFQYRESSIPSSGRGVSGLTPNTDAYLAQIWEWQQAVIAADTVAAPYQPAMASKEYGAPDDVFDRAANPYPKGALLLHMLRCKLGDETFFRALADYVRTYQFTEVETFQLRECFEKAGGVSLQRFFDQWAYRPQVPKVHVTTSWSDDAHTLTVSFEQTQAIDGYNPAFDLSIPLWVRSGTKAPWTKLNATFDTRTYSLSAQFDAEPDMILIDPELTALADFDLDTPQLPLAEQLGSAPTLGAKLRAARTLGRLEDKNPVAISALASAIRDPHSPRELAIQAAKSLADLGPDSAATCAALLNDHYADPRIRAAVFEQAAIAAKSADDATRGSIAEKLAATFAAESSYAVRAACIRGLGTLKLDSSLTTIRAALQTRSHADQIRVAAVGALADFDRADSLPTVLSLAAPNPDRGADICIPVNPVLFCLENSSDLRPAAINALAKLSHHNPDQVFNILAAFLDDHEPRVQEAAGKALSTIGGDRVRTLLTQRAATLPSRYWQGQTRNWLHDMKEDPAPEPAKPQAVDP